MASSPAQQPHALEASKSNEAARFGKALPTRTLAGFVAAALAVLVIAGFSYRSLQDRTEAKESTSRVVETLRHLELLMADLRDAETGQRGFLLTGDETYLEPFNRASESLPGELEQVRQLTAASPLQQQRFKIVEAQSTEKIAELRHTIDLRRDGNMEAAMSVVRSDRGKAAMDTLRANISDMEGEERSVLAVHNEQWQQAATFSAMVTWIGSGLLLFLVAAAAYMSSKDFRAQQIEVWLRSSQSELGERVGGEQPIEKLGERVLAFLAGRLGAQLGVLYTVELDGTLRRAAGHALPPAAVDKDQVLRIGDGLAGQALKENRIHHIRDVPEGYFPAMSGLGQARVRELLIAPTHVDGAVNGVIELGFFHAVQPTDVELLHRMVEVIGTALRSVRYRMQLEDLLEETQRQAEELRSQQEELRVSNEELSEQSEALRESQARLEMQQAELEQTNSHLESQAQLLTQQKEELSRAQEELTAKAGEIERASRYKSEFLANMSHELRTPLNSSLILAKLLADNKDGNLTGEQVKFANSIYAAGNDLLELINDILDLSKIEAGKMEVRPETVRLSRVIDALAATFKPLADQKRIGFSVVVEAGAPKSVETDPQRLQQVLKNLLSNAVKFTERGEVMLRVFPSGDQVGFAVTDTGIGIPEAQHAVIFEAFRQADGTTNRKYGGTGLGLSISRDLAALLGGRIELQSAPGRGSTFTLVLPTAYAPSAAEEKPAPAATPPPAIAAAPRRPAIPPPARPQARNGGLAFDDDRAAITDGARVLLVVEDDPAFAKVLYDLAHELSFRCVVAHTADEGMELALQFHPLAIVLDMHLPDHSGLTVLDRLKRTPSTRHVPVQIVSVEDYTQEALSMGAAGYMLKPVKREQIAEALSRMEAKVKQGIRSVLVVEDDPVQRESICHLLAAQDVKTVPVETAAAALEQLRASTHDCMVLDVSLPDASGFELLEKMAEENQYSFPPVIVYTGRSLSGEEEDRLRKYSKSIIIKGARSPERLLDEVTLFLHQVETALPPDRQKMLAEARSRESLFEGRSVLLVEDDVRNIFALSSVIEPKGAQLQIARNGKEALAALDKGPSVDLVLMDIMMPEMDGYEAMRQIREKPNLAKLPIIALTAKAMRDDQERCLEAGANDYIAKPIVVDKLLSLMRVWMPKSKV
jgi:CheY-like chemotaxis protein/CHASE3 domain sensor protein/GAF domain-containing protein